MNHLSWDDVWAYIEGESAVNVGDIDNHLRTCAECSRKVTSALRLNDSLNRILRAGMSDVPEERTQQLFEALRNAQPELRERANGRRRRPWVWISSLASATAAVVVGVVLGLNALQRHMTTASDASDSAASVAVTRSGNHAGAEFTASASLSAQALLQDSKQANAVDDKLLNTGSVTGAAQVVVRDMAGHPLPGVHVAFVENGKVGPVLTTDASGKTPEQRLQIPTDPMLQAFFGKDLPPSGVVTVVAWKDGYRPVVRYDTGVFQDGSPYQPTLTMEASANPQVSVTGSGVQGTYPDVVLEEIPKSAARWIADSKVAERLNHLPLGTATLHVRVTNQDGEPVSKATVVVFAKGQITGYGVTSADGRVTLFPTGATDWRRALNDSALDAVQMDGSIVVLKNDYAPALGLYQPLAPGRARDVEVRLESYHYRKQLGMTNTELPNRIAGSVVLTEDDGQRTYKLVLASMARR